MQPNPDLRPVVVAVDNSDSARDAAAWAADLAADWSAPLHVLHVMAGYPRDLPPSAPAWLAELADAAERVGVHPSTTEVLAGGVVETVSARGVGARIVVLGSYGKDAIAGMLAGSIALGIVNRVTCPVAIVRGSAPRLAPPHGGPVVVGVDESPAGEAALSFSADLAASLGARLVAVHAWSDVEVGPDGGPQRRPEPPESRAAAASDALEAHLASVRARHPQLEIEAQVVEATPLRTLIEHAPGARMIVVGTRGGAGHPGIMMGSTSSALLEFAPCPVIIVHRRRPVRTADVSGSAVGARS